MVQREKEDERKKEKKRKKERRKEGKPVGQKQNVVSYIWLERFLLKPEWADFMSERTERTDRGRGINKQNDK